MKNWKPTIDCILDAPIPQDTHSYTAIPHSVFLTEIKDELTKRDYTVVDERYLTIDSCKVITGVYKVASQVITDLEMAPSITFVNSYNKKRVASVRASALVLACTNGMCGIVENGSYSRKHTGNALEEFREHLQLVIDGLQKEFERLVLNKEEMKSIQLTKVKKSQIIGDMLLEKMISPRQLSVLLKEIKKPSYPEFSGDSLWAFYNHCTEAFKDSHPMFFDKQHIAFHTYICDKFQLTGSNGLFEKLVAEEVANEDDFDEIEKDNLINGNY